MMSMSSKLTFGDLKHIDDCHIRSNVTVHIALKICTKSLEIGEAYGSEIFFLWVNKWIKAFDVEFSSAECIELTQCLKDTCKQLVSTSPFENSAATSERILWLNDSLTFLKWIRSLISQFNAVAICTVLAFTLDTVQRFLDYCEKWCDKDKDKDGAVASLLRVTIELHKLVVTVLVDHVNVFSLTECDEFISLTQLVVALCKVCEHTSGVDIMTMAETWKCVTKIVLQCAKSPHCPSTAANDKVSLEWMQRPLKFLLQEISRSTQVVYMKDTQKQPIQQVEKYLRVTNFYLKLLQRLAAVFEHAKFSAIVDLCDVLCITESMPEFLRGTQVAEVIQKFVLNDLDDVFRRAYKNPGIHEQLLRHLRQHKAESSTALVIKYFRFCVADADLDYIDSNVDAFHPIFEELFKAAFVSSCAYNEIVELYAALTILSRNGRLKRHLRRNVVKGHLHTALSSTDVLLVAARLMRAQPGELISELHFWRRCNELFAPFSHNPNALFVERLLKNAFELCTLCDEIKNSDLWNTCAADQQLSLTKYRFLKAVGLASVCSFDTILGIKIARELADLVPKINDGCTTDQYHYYKMVAFTNLLSGADVVPDKKLLGHIFGLLANIFQNSTISSARFSLLLDAIFRLAAAFASAIDDLLMQSLTRLIENNVHHFKEMSLVSAKRFFIAFSSLKTISPLSGLWKVIILSGSTKDGELVRLVITPNNALKFKQWKMSNDLRKQFIAIRSSHIVCKELECSSHVQNLKRTHSDADGDTDLKSIIIDLDQKSKRIVQLSEQLDSEDVWALNSIIDNLKIAIAP